MRIAFHSNQLGLRGTEVALYDYADYNEKLLGHESIIVTATNAHIREAAPKFTQRFKEVFLLSSFDDLENFIIQNSIDVLYMIKGGSNDGIVSNTVPTLIHSVFACNEPHGSKYVYVSDWLARQQGYDPITKSVPHIVQPLPKSNLNLREKLNINSTDIVFGRHGGFDSFNIGFVKETIKKVVTERNDVKFILLNTDEFFQHPNIYYLPGTWDLGEKSSFIEACDAMIYARHGGETFGLACAEFSMCNKPVVMYRDSTDRNHIEIIGDRGIYYSDENEVYDILNNLKSYIKHDDYNRLYDQFSPEIIMKRFENCFLN